jgi:hypothetical protein
VFRLTTSPDFEYSVLEETGHVAGRFVGEGRLSRGQPQRLVLYDGQNARIFEVERRAGADDDIRVTKFIDADGQSIDARLVRMKLRGRLRTRAALGASFAITDAAKAEIGSLQTAPPPQGTTGPASPYCSRSPTPSIRGFAWRHLGWGSK